MDGANTITFKSPGREPVTTDLKTFQRAVEGLTRKDIREAAARAERASAERALSRDEGRIEDPRQLALDDHPEFQRAAEASADLFNNNADAGPRLKAFIERIERLAEEKAVIAGDMKEVYLEAKGNGFDTKIIRKIIAIRKVDFAQRQEEEAILEMYMQALGMV